MTVAIIISLIMVGLGFWQLERADQKKQILSQQLIRAEQEAVNIATLINPIVNDHKTLRFRKVTARGEFLEEHTLYIDNQVHNSKVGFRLITPFKFYISDEILSEYVILVDRGWLPAGMSRKILPEFTKLVGVQTINGRLNVPFPQPPLWSDKYPIFDGLVWQFLPIEQFSEQTNLDVLPLVLELAPSRSDNSAPNVKLVPIVNWQIIDDEWVYKHQAYAFQWFSMSTVFFIACLIVLFKSLRKHK